MCKHSKHNFVTYCIRGGGFSLQDKWASKASDPRQKQTETQTLAGTRQAGEAVDERRL